MAGCHEPTHRHSGARPAVPTPNHTAHASGAGCIGTPRISTMRLLGHTTAGDLMPPSAPVPAHARPGASTRAPIVLVLDKLDPEGLDILRAAGLEVRVKTG